MNLRYINFINNKIFNTKKIIFSNSDSENCTTVLIGPNGAGKSCLLREICRIFRDTYGRKNGPYEKKVLEYKYEFGYTMNNDSYEVKFENEKKIYYINKKKCNLNDWNFPNTVIAVSSIPTDKFIYSSNKDESIYKYAGIRSSNNSSGTKTIIKNIIDLLKISNYEKIKPLTILLQELHFKEEFIVYYNSRIDNLYKIFTCVDDLNNYFENWNARSSRMTVPFNISYYKKLDFTLKEKILKFLKEAFQEDFIGFNLFDLKDYKSFKENYDVLYTLYKLDLLKTPEILFNKDDSYNNDLEISSGEYNLFFQFLRILLLINDNSLLLIDEPEISLHPNWQIKYFYYLEKVLSDYKGIHTIIATHSHLLLTGLNPNQSNVITITGNKEFENLDYYVSGWSPENILYRVFGITSQRNYYFEIALRQLVSFIETGNGDLKKIRSIIDNLEQFKLSEEDPLKEIIDTAKKRIIK